MNEIAEEPVVREATPVAPSAGVAAAATTMSVLWALSLSHLLNDTVQALIPAMYPVLEGAYGLSFADVGMITFVFQMAGSVLQPLVGTFTDRRPMPYSLPAGMGVTLAGLLLLATAGSFGQILRAAALVGAGSAVFHPERRRGSRGWRPGGGTGLRRACSRSAGTSAARSARCWRRV